MKSKTRKVIAIIVGIILMFNVFAISASAVTYQMQLGLNNNSTYYRIRNVKSGKYMTVPNSTSTDGTDLTANYYNGSSGQHFKIIFDSATGSSVIIPACATGSAIEITNSSPSDGAVVQIWTKPSGGYMNSQKFHIMRNADGTYAMGSYVSNITQGVAVKNGATSSGTPVVQHYLGSSVSNYQAWSFEPVTKNFADYFTFNITGNINSTAYNNSVKTSLDNMGYIGFTAVNYPATTAFYCLQQYDIFSFAGHGNTGLIAFFDQNGGDNGYIFANEDQYTNPNSNYRFIDSLGYNALAANRCVIYMGCKTGLPLNCPAGHWHNLVDNTYNKGAHFALGTKIDVTNSCAFWTACFYSAAYSGLPIVDCINYANQCVNYNGNLYYKGDIYQCLK